MARLIFICGHSGAGKTTLSKALVRRLNELTRESFFLLDKDTAYSKYSARVMGLLTGDLVFSMIHGKPVVRDGKLLTMDEAAVMRTAAGAARKIWAIGEARGILPASPLGIERA